MANLWLITTFIFFSIFIIENAILFLIKIINARWNIPVIVLRFVGSKGRPSLMVRKGRKFQADGVNKLRVRGYQHPIRDFKAENYYPCPGKPFGALILWEFEDGYLTPVVPDKDPKGLTQEQKAAFLAVKKNAFNALSALSEYQTVPFKFERELHEDLKLKAIDDVDVEFYLTEQKRLNIQYVAGWRDFLMKYGGHLTIVMIAMLMLVGVIFGFIKGPEFFQACASAGQETAKQFVDAALNQISGNTPPPG